jgi:hypothetical protein
MLAMYLAAASCISRTDGKRAASRKVVGSIPDEDIGFFNWPNPSNQPSGRLSLLTEMSTRNHPGGKGRLTDNLTAICEPLSRKCEGRRLTTLWASTAIHRDRFNFLDVYKDSLDTGLNQRKEYALVLPARLEFQ